MNRNLILALSASTAIALPMTAQAQDISSVNITANTPEVCDLGQPDDLLLELSNLTGSDGKITTALGGSASAASTLLVDSWCSTPSRLSVDASPLQLQNPTLVTVPAGFSRAVTYNATLTGWPTVAVDRPFIGVPPAPAASVTASGAHADDLRLDISDLASLNASGSAAESLPLEAGRYLGLVTISVAVQ